MLKLNVLLLVLVVMCALGVVSVQHEVRKLFVELQREQERAQQMEVEWGQLQLEQATLALPSRVESVASTQLQMQLPQPVQTRYVHIGNVK